jgi:hypothetical protein
MPLKNIIAILAIFMLAMPVTLEAQNRNTAKEVDFYGKKLSLTLPDTELPRFNGQLTTLQLEAFVQKMDESGLEETVVNLYEQAREIQLDDWLYYQLIRKMVQELSPKAANYYEYTLYKWYFLTRSGYEAILTFCDDKLLFYVRCNEKVYNIPTHQKGEKQFACLNYHDYGSNIDFSKNRFTEASLPSGAKNTFSYRISRLPEFKQDSYTEKELHFAYRETEYSFKIKTNEQVKTLFRNYPTVDYESCFNIPLSKETYESLIPLLRKSLKGLSSRAGIEYLLHFTRYAFLFENDTRIHGTEKRFSPEQTLLFDQSDCEDRAALFFFLVKEIYNLPMLVLAFPQHVTIAVKLEKPIGQPVIYNGMSYSICEPSPQKKNLAVGEWLPGLETTSYQVAYAYQPR